MFLPLNTYTEWIWTGSLYAWARVYNQHLLIRLRNRKQTTGLDTGRYLW